MLRMKEPASASTRQNSSRLVSRKSGYSTGVMLSKCFFRVPAWGGVVVMRGIEQCVLDAARFGAAGDGVEMFLMFGTVGGTNRLWLGIDDSGAFRVGEARRHRIRQGQFLLRQHLKQQDGKAAMEIHSE